MAPPAHAATDYSESHELFKEIMAVGAKMVELFIERDMELVKLDVDLIRTANEKQTLKSLSDQYTYTIFATGQPSRISDLDLEIYRLPETGKPELIAKDTEIDNAPAVQFKPPTAGTYLIVIKAAAMVKGFEEMMGYYFLAVGHD